MGIFYYLCCGDDATLYICQILLRFTFYRINLCNFSSATKRNVTKVTLSAVTYNVDNLSRRKGLCSAALRSSHVLACRRVGQPHFSTEQQSPAKGLMISLVASRLAAARSRRVSFLLLHFLNVFV